MQSIPSGYTMGILVLPCKIALAVYVSKIDPQARLLSYCSLLKHPCGGVQSFLDGLHTRSRLQCDITGISMSEMATDMELAGA